MELQPWMMLVLFVLQTLVSIILAMIGFFMRQIVLDLRVVTSDLRGLKEEFLRNGMQRQHFEEYRKETRERIHNLGDRVGALEGAFRILHKIDMLGELPR